MGFDIIRNAGLILCALTGIWILLRAKQASYSLPTSEWILVGLGAMVLVLIWIKLGDVMQVLSREN